MSSVEIENATHPGTRRKLIMVTSLSPLPLPHQPPHCQYLRKHANITQPINISSSMHDSSAIAIYFYAFHHFFPSPSPPLSHHYISFSSSSSPPRVDSSPGMTLPRPFNRREEGRPPTGWRLQEFFIRTAFPEPPPQEKRG